LRTETVVTSSPRIDAIFDEGALLLGHRSAGSHRLLLPPYSPDLNPIEQVFAKLKALLRNAGEHTIEATWRRIGAQRARDNGGAKADVDQRNPAISMQAQYKSRNPGSSEP
jgi:hypothetical protein